MKQETKVAAEYWTKFLTRGFAPMDNGDGPLSAFATVVSSKTKKVSQEQIDIFQRELERLIEADKVTSIHVDYHPEGALVKAAEKAGFNPENRFPIKTNMWIDNGKVRVSQGYAAPTTTLYVNNR